MELAQFAVAQPPIFATVLVPSRGTIAAAVASNPPRLSRSEVPITSSSRYSLPNIFRGGTAMVAAAAGFAWIARRRHRGFTTASQAKNRFRGRSKQILELQVGPPKMEEPVIGADWRSVPNVADLVQTKDPPKNLREWRLQTEDQIRSTGASWPAPSNDRLLRAARGEVVDRPPKWLMRQAGRYLPEYQATLADSDFFTVCQTPALAAEVTLQPYRRYPSLDSLIIFSDILVVPEAMGMTCRMEPLRGPVFDFAIRTPEDLKRLDLSPPVRDTLGYVYDGIFWTRQRVGNEVPVIGFSGAPWTLMGYMVEGGASRAFDRAKKWLYLYPEDSRRVLSALREIIVEYLVCQYDAGAPFLQVFDTNAGELPPAVYEEFCIPDLKYIAMEVKRRRPKALIAVFPKDGPLAPFDDSAYDVVGVSWATSPPHARRACPNKTLQGNFDPYALFAEPAFITAEVRKMVAEFGVDKYIANLGHGMLPTHSTDGPKAFVEAVDTCSRDNMVKDLH